MYVAALISLFSVCGVPAVVVVGAVVVIRFVYVMASRNK
jgi:uncharacterized membrane protein YbhN (UPF0104 family)